MFRLQKVSNYGTSTPAVVRTALQGHKLLQFFDCSEIEKEAAVSVLFELQRHLVKCVEIRDQLAAEISTGHLEADSKGFRQASGGVMSLPGVSDLQSKSETFLQSAKLAIAETGNLTKPEREAGGIPRPDFLRTEWKIELTVSQQASARLIRRHQGCRCTIHLRKERDSMESPFIQCQPDIMGGTPVFADSRVPVRTLVEYLEAGETIDDFLEGLPTVGRDKVLAFLEAAARHASLLCQPGPWIAGRGPQ